MKQIKNITLAATLLLLAAGCTADAEGEGMNIAPGTPIEVDFTLPGVSQIMPGSTRAVTTTPLEKGRTVRIIPYNERTKQEEAQATYYVTDDAGTLAPCTVNADGSFAAAATQKMKLKLGDSYTLSVISSALPYPGEKVNNGTDFAYSKKAKQIVSSKDITLPPLLHNSAQLKIVVKKAAADTYISGITAHGDANNPPIKLSGLRDTSTFLGHQDLDLLMPASTFNASLSVLPASITQTDATTLTTTPQYVLNGIQTLDIACMLNLSLKYSSVADAVTKQVTYVQKVTFNTSLSPGYSYLLTLEVNSENATVIPSVQITDWDMTGGDLTPPADYEGQPSLTMRYPYVTTNAEGKNRVIVTKDVFGEDFGITHGYFTIHAPWLQTPAHKLLNSVGDVSAEAYQVSAKFEIAENDVSDTPAPWGSTNGPCVAPWRRFTVGEYQMLTNAIKEKPLDITPFKQDPLYSYWLCEDENETEAYTLEFRTQPKSTPAYTRCVRDYGVISADYAHVMGSSIISKDEYGTTGGTFHPNWGSNDVPVHEEDSPENTVSVHFELSKVYSTGVGYPMYLAREYCSKYTEKSDKSDLGQWRLPTKAEALLMFKFKDKLTGIDPFTEYVTMQIETYPNGAAVAHYHPVIYWDPQTAPEIRDAPSDVRCVRDY